MEAWRQRPLGGREEKRAEQNETSIHLTPTGLLMEGDYTNYGQRVKWRFFANDWSPAHN